MRAAVLALALVAATAAPAGWSYMDDSTACLHDGLSSTFMTCALPASTTYDNAFNLAASLPRCGKHSEDCYDDKLCRYVPRESIHLKAPRALRRCCRATPRRRALSPCSSAFPTPARCRACGTTPPRAASPIPNPFADSCAPHSRSFTVSSAPSLVPDAATTASASRTRLSTGRSRPPWA